MVNDFKRSQGSSLQLIPFSSAARQTPVQDDVVNRTGGWSAPKDRLDRSFR